MSFEGYYVFLCQQGHSTVRDVYYEEPTACHVCGEPMAWRCMVDQTNGEDPDDPGSMPPEMEEIGADDQWSTDHYGNQFARRVECFQPVGARWRALKARESGHE